MSTINAKLSALAQLEILRKERHTWTRSELPFDEASREMQLLLDKIKSNLSGSPYPLEVDLLRPGFTFGRTGLSPNGRNFYIQCNSIGMEAVAVKLEKRLAFHNSTHFTVTLTVISAGGHELLTRVFDKQICGSTLKHVWREWNETSESVTDNTTGALEDGSEHLVHDIEDLIYKQVKIAIDKRST